MHGRRADSNRAAPWQTALAAAGTSRGLQVEQQGGKRDQAEHRGPEKLFQGVVALPMLQLDGKDGPSAAMRRAEHSVLLGRTVMK